jgi:phosphonate degradation associated HDIG domain protein
MAGSGEQRVEERVARLMDLLESSAGAGYIGESVSQLDHALQAAQLAEAAGAPAHEVLAALLHDVGHLCEPDAPRMGGVGVVRHEEVGCAYLARLGFAASVTELVRGHVAAKRYLVVARPGYGERLSAASRHTLAHQGGPMDEAERRAFEADPLRDAKLRLRAWDEEAKVPGRETPGVEHYRERLVAHLHGAC